MLRKWLWIANGFIEPIWLLWWPEANCTHSREKFLPAQLQQQKLNNSGQKGPWFPARQAPTGRTLHHTVFFFPDVLLFPCSWFSVWWWGQETVSGCTWNNRSTKEWISVRSRKSLFFYNFQAQQTEKNSQTSGHCWEFLHLHTPLLI